MDTKNNEVKKYYLITDGQDPHPSTRGVVGFRYLKATENEYGILNGPSVFACAYVSFVKIRKDTWNPVYNGFIYADGYMSVDHFTHGFMDIEDLANHIIVQHAAHDLAQDFILIDEAIPNDDKQGTSSYRDDVYYHFKRLDPHPILVSGLKLQFVDSYLPTFPHCNQKDD